MRSDQKSCGDSLPCPVIGALSIIWIAVAVLCLSFPAFAQFPAAPPETPGPTVQQTATQAPGSISGTVVDPSGAAVAGARVALAREGQSGNQEVRTDDNGQFTFVNIAPGQLHLTVAADGFATQTLSITLHSAENYSVPQITLTVAAAKTEVQVTVPRVEVAEEQIKQEEKQRVLGVVPNYYAVYVPDAVPLSTKQKFKLAWKSSVDPVTFLLTGAFAGAQQADNVFKGYGQGAQGYGKRYGADYADLATNTFIGSAILPSLLKQDPRYFYKGTGSTRSRILYALKNSVMCKGDNGRWQPNYSDILGSLAAGGLSNLYYPPEDRHGAALTFENTALGIGATAAANLLQEFVLRKLTPNARNHDPSKP